MSYGMFLLSISINDVKILFVNEGFMKILIAGAGKVGKSITDELSADGNDITMIDRNADVLNDVIEKYDVNT